MVTLNFTLFVELGLFLLFLWGTQAFVLKRVLRRIDEREKLIAEQTEDAASRLAEAAAREQEYLETLTSYHREADEQFRAARQQIVNEYQDRLQEARTQADAEVAAVRAETVRQREAQRADIAAAAPELAALIEERLAHGEKAHG